MLKHRYIKPIGLSGIILLLVAIYFHIMTWYILVIWLLFWVGLTIWGSFDIRLNYFLKALHHQKNSSKNAIALTFDDGPHPNTNQILDLLQKHQMKATFFCIGTQVEKHPEIVQRMVNEGHIIANHTYTHTSKMGFLSKEKLINEIEKCNDVIEKATGKKAMLYRPPFGVTNPNIAKTVEKSELTVIGWNVRSLDTIIASEEQLLKRLLRRISAGSIVLLHDNRAVTLQILERLLISLQKKQLTSVTVSDLLNIKPYRE